MINVIAFVGKAESGKTTAAYHVVEEHGYVRLRFADTLKKMMYALGLDEREVDGDLKACACELLGGKTPRHAMQTLGTEWGRDLIHNSLWINTLDRAIKKYVSEGYKKFVIDDLRFVNEASYLDSLKKNGYKVVIVGIERDKQENKSTHVSETQMNNITPDHIIFNHYDMEVLYKSIDEILEHYFNEEK